MRDRTTDRDELNTSNYVQYSYIDCDKHQLQCALLLFTMHVYIHNLLYNINNIIIYNYQAYKHSMCACMHAIIYKYAPC